MSVETAIRALVVMKWAGPYGGVQQQQDENTAATTIMRRMKI
jgi:hypothetical protein